MIKSIDEKRSDIESNQRKHKKWFQWIFFGILILWFCFYGVMERLFPNLKLNEFGDAFGSLNTLFSGFAFLGVVYAIILQKEELQYQRLELEMTRDELEGSKKALLASSKALEEQNKTQEIQRFENTFFSFLKLYQDVLEGMRSGRGENMISGRSFIFNITQSVFNISNREVLNNKNKKALSVFLENYNHYYKHNSNELGHYFRNLYRIFRFIDNSKLKDDEKIEYAKTIRAQFSNAELMLLFYNSLDDLGLGGNFRKYIIQYELLNNIDMSDFDNEYKFQLVSQYPWNTYGPSGQNETVL